MLTQVIVRTNFSYPVKQENDNLHNAKDDGSNGHEIVVANGHCIDRLCVKDGMLTIRYLHPTDSGKYICEAKSKYGKDQRQVHLTVKVTAIIKCPSHYKIHVIFLPPSRQKL